MIGTHLCSKIVKLNLLDVWNFSDRNLLSLVLRCKDIEVLHLGCTAITRVGVYIIIKHLPKLTHLALSKELGVWILENFQNWRFCTTLTPKNHEKRHFCTLKMSENRKPQVL